MVGKWKSWLIRRVGGWKRGWKVDRKVGGWVKSGMNHGAFDGLMAGWAEVGK